MCLQRAQISGGPLMCHLGFNRLDAFHLVNGTKTEYYCCAQVCRGRVQSTTYNPQEHPQNRSHFTNAETIDHKRHLACRQHTTMMNDRLAGTPNGHAFCSH